MTTINERNGFKKASKRKDNDTLKKWLTCFTPGSWGQEVLLDELCNRGESPENC